MLSFQAGLVKSEETPAFSQQMPVTVCAFSWRRQYAYQYFSEILRHPHQVGKDINIVLVPPDIYYIDITGMITLITFAFLKCFLCAWPKTQPEAHSAHSCAG